MGRRAEAGFGLILLIALVAVSSLLISATSLAFVNNGRALQLRIDRVKAYYLAQAGVMQAVQDWRDSNNTLANRRYSPLNTTVMGNQIFKAAQATSDFAYYSPAGSNWLANVRLRNWTIRNISTATPFTVTNVRVSWAPAGSTLQTIRLNNNTVLAAGAYANGATLALSGTPAQRTLASGGTWTGNNTYLQWNATPPNPINVTVEWTFSDDSATKHSKSHVVTYWNGTKAAAAPTVQTFAVTSTGQVDQALLKTVRTVKAVISGTVMEIIDWDDVDKNQV